MKILLLAPHPFYHERGTPIAVDLLLQALSKRGDEVDVLTFHEGSDRHYDNLTIHRVRPWIKVVDIPPGLSLKKIICDVHMFFKLVSLVRRKRYDVVHAVEESAFMALAVCPLRSIPFVFDMDSSMTTQIVAQHPVVRPLQGIMRFIESLPMRYAAVVVPMCDALADDAARVGAKNVVVLKDVSLVKKPVEGVEKIRDELDLTGRIAMYIGNLERYQGIALMLESFAIVKQQNDDVSLVIIGGIDSHIAENRQLAESLGIADHVYFLGRKPVAHIGDYMAQADILLSPRTEGVNTPMKIYSYLHSGTAVLATDLPTHTQVMNGQIARLAEPTKQDFAIAMQELLDDDGQRAELASKAREHIDREHSYPVFEARVNDLYTQLEQRR
ncbi:MAG: glycosyltransferase [Gammaproteobacteria bacterium]|nr:glycosyltransferase [Gammaproteobacteria bacterium]